MWGFSLSVCLAAVWAFVIGSERNPLSPEGRGQGEGLGASVTVMTHSRPPKLPRMPLTPTLSRWERE